MSDSNLQKVTEPAAGFASPASACSAADLEECLAGFMLVARMNGAYLDDEMIEWCRTKLEGKQRTPVEVWRTIARKPPNPAREARET